MRRSGRPGPAVPFLLTAAVAASFLAVPAAAAAGSAGSADGGLSTTVGARTADPSGISGLQAGGDEVVWVQAGTDGDTAAHAWLSVSGGAPQELGVPAESADITHPDVVSVQGGILALTDGGPNADDALQVTLKDLASGRQDTLPVARDAADGGPGSEHYVGQAGDGILVQQLYRADDGQYDVRLIRRTRAADGTLADRALLDGDMVEYLTAGDADGAVVQRMVAPTAAYEWDYVDYATGTVTPMLSPHDQSTPDTVEFTPDRFGYAEDGRLHEWSRTDPAAGSQDSALPVSARIYAVTDDTVLWQEGAGHQKELWGQNRDGSAGPADLGVSVGDAVTDEHGRLRVLLETADEPAAIRTVTGGRVSRADGSTVTPVSQPAYLWGMSMSGGALYVSDNSSRLGGSLFRTTPRMGASGATAATDRLFTLPDGYSGSSVVAGAGGRVLLSDPLGQQVFGLDGSPVGAHWGTNDTLLGFDGTRGLYDGYTGTLRLHDFITGVDTRVPRNSILNDDGTLVTTTRTSTSVQVERTKLATGTATDLGTFACGWGQAQAVGDWLLLTGCGSDGTNLLQRIGATAGTTVTSSAGTPILTATTVYSFTPAQNSGAELHAQPLGSSAAPRALFTVPGNTAIGIQRWAVDPNTPWAAWIDDDNVTHLVWTGAPTLAPGTVPTGFSPNGDGRSDTWTPAWSADRAVRWTLTLRSGSSTVRTLTGTATGGRVAAVWDGRTGSGANAAAGTYSWTLNGTDTVTGAAARPLTGTLALRRSAPAAVVTAPALAAGAGSAPDWKLTWSGKTAGALSYDLAYRTVHKSGSSWVLGPLTTWRSGVKAGSASVRSGTAALRPAAGQTFRFYVRAHDDAGQTGPWSSPAVTTVPTDDRSTAIHWTGSWYSVSARSAWAGTQRSTTRSGATATFTADGTKVAIVATKAADGGRFAVLVDGRQVAVVDTRTVHTTYGQTVFSRTLGAKDTKHIVQIRTLASSGGIHTVRLDAIAVTH